MFFICTVSDDVSPYINLNKSLFVSIKKLKDDDAKNSSPHCRVVFMDVLELGQ